MGVRLAARMTMDSVVMTASSRRWWCVVVAC